MSVAVSCALCWAFRIIVVDSLSDKNPLVKQIRRAVSKGTLTEGGYAVAEGAHLLEEALAAKCEVGAVIVAESAHLHYPDARVVYSGGSNGLFEKQNGNDAQNAARFYVRTDRRP